MSELVLVAPAALVSSPRQRMIDDMNRRNFSRETQRNYIRDVVRFATSLGALPIPPRPRICVASKSSSARARCRCRP